MVLVHVFKEAVHGRHIHAGKKLLQEQEKGSQSGVLNQLMRYKMQGLTRSGETIIRTRERKSYSHKVFSIT